LIADDLSGPNGLDVPPNELVPGAAVALWPRIEAVFLWNAADGKDAADDGGTNV
jgi:hypothetical protein